MDVLEDPARVLFLDVETTGLSWYYDEITVVGWAYGASYNVHLPGDNPRPLFEALQSATALVTFNGTLFDLRFLRQTFSDLAIPPVHIDLRYLAKRAGLTGGQKAIENILGISARSNVKDVDGAEAVLLWHRFLRGDESSLRRLIEYNRCDVLGMCRILDEVLDRLDIHPDLLFSRPRFAGRSYAPAESAARPSFVPPRRSKHKKRSNKFREMFARTAAGTAKIVGIDLTGSEARPSGWCLLKGAEATTDMISTDADMLSRIAAERPDVVSIDSPLSIPYGRTRVSDDDPGRDEFGIMRRCERELKRRGINVYPCLLPSMQGLTRRGMRLAEQLRAMGIPVIESYPGAAQDIMGIPRKGAGEQFLKQGLADFGIKGQFLKEDVCHDELDAITSALVGSFFLAGKYEALSGPTEGALIIPDLQAKRPARFVVGISGRICAGKTTAARMLEQRGFTYTRFSMVIDEEILARGEVPNRRKRQEVGDEIHRTKGQRWLCEKVVERVGDRELIVVDGLRFPEDQAFFAEQFGTRFVHLHIVAPAPLRAARYGESVGGDISFEEADRQSVEGEIDELAGLASLVLTNVSTLDAMQNALYNFIASAGQKDGRQCRFQSS